MNSTVKLSTGGHLAYAVLVYFLVSVWIAGCGRQGLVGDSARREVAASDAVLKWMKLVQAIQTEASAGQLSLPQKARIIIDGKLEDRALLIMNVENKDIDAVLDRFAKHAISNQVGPFRLRFAFTDEDSKVVTIRASRLFLFDGQVITEKQIRRGEDGELKWD